MSLPHVQDGRKILADNTTLKENDIEGQVEQALNTIPTEELITEVVNTRPPPMIEPRGGEGSYKKHNDLTKEQFFFLVYEKGMTAGKAAKQLAVAPRTAYEWLKRDKMDAQEKGELDQSRRKANRRAVLTKEHQEYLEYMFRDFPSATLNQVMESLSNQFIDIKVSKTAVYNFMIEKCALSLKKAHFHATEKNTPLNIENRYNWIVRWGRTEMNYSSNCVFVDECAFQVTMKRSMAWTKKGTPTDGIQSSAKSRITTIFGCISALEIIDVRVRRPLALERNQNELKDKSMGRIPCYYYNYIGNILDILDTRPEYKGYFIVMNNAPVHSAEAIENLILSRGYQCVYLPFCSPDLNPIEQFWSVVTDKLRREKFLENETLTTRISDACNNILLQDLQAFCCYSASRFTDCLHKYPL